MDKELQFGKTYKFMTDLGKEHKAMYVGKQFGNISCFKFENDFIRTYDNNFITEIEEYNESKN